MPWHHLLRTTSLLLLFSTLDAYYNLARDKATTHASADTGTDSANVVNGIVSFCYDTSIYSACYNNHLNGPYKWKAAGFYNSYYGTINDEWMYIDLGASYSIKSLFIAAPSVNSNYYMTVWIGDDATLDTANTQVYFSATSLKSRWIYCKTAGATGAIEHDFSGRYVWISA